MNKTEQKKFNTKNVIELLSNQFNAFDIEDSEGNGRIGFTIGKEMGEFHRRDFHVMMRNTIKMGSGFTQEEYASRARVVVLESNINLAIKKLLK